jgi:N-acetylglucosaminyl-diphospho-decaprenol L-rhamnosyltransferase
MASAVTALYRRPGAPGICLSVVSHGQGELVDRLLVDLAALPEGAIAHVIVTVNLAVDSWQLRDQPGLPRITVIRNRRALGFGANHNQAFAQCMESIFAVVNPDIRLAGNPFPELLGRFADDEDCALVAPVQVDTHGERESFARPVPTPWSIVWRRLVPAEARSRVSPGQAARWVAGAFMLWRAEAFRGLGGFDGRYRLYCEDVDICLRLQLDGKHFAVVESVHVVHDARRASRASLRLLLVHLRSLVRLWLSPVFWRYLLLRPQPEPATA